MKHQAARARGKRLREVEERVRPGTAASEPLALWTEWLQLQFQGERAFRGQVLASSAPPGPPPRSHPPLFGTSSPAQERGMQVLSGRDTWICMAESPCRVQETSTTLLIGNTPMQNQKLKKLYSEFKKKRSSKDNLKAVANHPAPPPPHHCGSRATVAASWTAVPAPRLGGQGRLAGSRSPPHPGSPGDRRETRVLAPTSLLGQVEIRILPHLTTPGPPGRAHYKRNTAAGQASFPFPEAKDKARRGTDEE